MSSKGKSIRKIAEEIFLDRKTVKKYLESDGKWHHESTGVKKGKINKIKVIKRIMYGRCNFHTLRNKILKLEDSA